MSSEIRPARPGEEAALAELVHAAYRGVLDPGGWTTETELVSGVRITTEEVAALVADPTRRLLVLPEEDRPLACFQLEDHGGGVAHFGLFAVRPGAQGRGTGRRMLREAERRARTDFGAHTLEMQVLEGRTELIAWYGRLGFTDTGERRPFPKPELLAREMAFAVLAKAL